MSDILKDSYDYTEDDTSYEESDALAEDLSTSASQDDLNGQAVIKNTDYNGVQFDDDSGILVTSSGFTSLFNATDGILITRLSDDALMFSVDSTTGDVTFAGILNGAGGSFSGDVDLYLSDVLAAKLANGSLTFYDQNNGNKIGAFAQTYWTAQQLEKGISLNIEDSGYISFGYYNTPTADYRPILVLNPYTALPNAPNGATFSLPINGSSISLSNQPFVESNKSVAANIQPSTWTKIQNTANTNRGGGTWSNGDYTVPSDGVYQCTLAAYISNLTAGASLRTGVYVNGVFGDQNGLSQKQAYGAGDGIVNGSVIINCVAGDVLSFWIYQGTASVQSLVYAHMKITKLS
jgi:hypothetical protein